MNGTHTLTLGGQPRTLVFTLEALVEYGKAHGEEAVRLFPAGLAEALSAPGGIEALPPDEQIPALAALLRFSRELVYVGLVGYAGLMLEPLAESRNDVLLATMGLSNDELVAVFHAYATSQVVGSLVKNGMQAQAEQAAIEKKKAGQAARKALRRGRT